MAYIIKYEKEIQTCNGKLLETLSNYKEANVDLEQLINAYAYDVMFATTTGHPAGFLEKTQDTAKLAKAMRDFRFYSVLYGTYFRIRPYIAESINRVFARPPDLQQELHVVLSRVLQDCALGGLTPLLLKATESDSDESHSIVDACVALVTAGADPVTSQSLISLAYIYSNPQLLDDLRIEIKTAGISASATIFEVKRHKAKLPLLHAILHEASRPHRSTTSAGSDCASPAGGIWSGHHHAIIAKLLLQLVPAYSIRIPPERVSASGISAATMQEAEALLRAGGLKKVTVSVPSDPDIKPDVAVNDSAPRHTSSPVNHRKRDNRRTRRAQTPNMTIRPPPTRSVKEADKIKVNAWQAQAVQFGKEHDDRVAETAANWEQIRAERTGPKKEVPFVQETKRSTFKQMEGGKHVATIVTTYAADGTTSEEVVPMKKKN